MKASPIRRRPRSPFQSVPSQQRANVAILPKYQPPVPKLRDHSLGGSTFNHPTPRSFVVGAKSDHKQITTAGAQAMLDMIRDNYCLEHIGMNLRERSGHGKAWYHTRINMFLRLNHAGRRRLLQGATPSRRDWLQTVEAVQDDFNAIRYLVQSNPTLWLSGST
jgi:hypothetical protein